MKKIALEQTQEYKNSELCIATEYDFKDKDIERYMKIEDAH